MCATCGCSPHGPHAHEAGHVHPHEDHPHSHPHPHPHAHVESPPPPPLDHATDRLRRLERDVLEKNDHAATKNREWLEARDILALNLVSSPGAGKTTLLERTIRELGAGRGGPVYVSVIEGDQETERDADRIREAGARAVQINTGTGCHLDADMVGRALARLDPPPGSLLMIENVGNLVCPALFDLGERAKVVIMSAPEGEDKPIKYPHMFRASELMLLNKVDLLPHLSFDRGRCLAYARRVNPRLDVLEVSATRGDGLDTWFDWIQERRRRGAKAAAAGGAR